jgi:glycine cleavage system H lipoate-binding protein
MTVLFVIATIVIFLTIDWFVQRSRQSTVQPIAQKKTSVEPFTVRLPEGIFFAPSHTWLNLFPSGKVRLGVDDFISGLLKKPVITLLKHSGEEVHKGDPLILLEEANHHLTVRSPLEGRIFATNDDLPKNPQLLKDKLFSDGWAYMMKPYKLNEVTRMLIGDETRTWIRHEFRRLKDLFAGLRRDGSPQPAFLQEGGPPISGALSSMDDTVWQQIDQEFLRVE